MTEHSPQQCVVVKAALQMLQKGIKSFEANPGPKTCATMLKAAVASHEILADHFGFKKKYEHLVDVFSVLVPLEDVPQDSVTTLEE